MPKVPSSDLAQAPAQTHLLAAELETSFFGGTVASDPFDSQRLREGVFLISRVCTRLKLAGNHTSTIGRSQSASLILCLFERREDRDRVADLAAAPASEEGAGGWASRRTFSLSAAVHERLVSVGGETDHRHAGRRRREREAAAPSLRWRGA